MTEPRPTSEIDYELTHTIKRFHRLRWWSVAALAIVVIIALTVGGLFLNRQQRQLTASCGLYHDLAQLPVRPAPPLKRPSEVGVVIVIDARKAFTGQCSGHLNPAAPSLIYWARYYHLLVTAPGGRQ